MGIRTFMEIMLKTIYQSQEIGVGEMETIKVKAPFGFLNKHRRAKAVSFHGVKVPKADDSLSWCLQLKRSSASTNVSILNLTESDSYEFKTSENNASSSSESEDWEENAESQTESAGLCENLEQRQQEVEELDTICNKMEEKLSRISKKLEAICEKRESLNNLKYEILKDISSFQGLQQSVESVNETAQLRDLNQNMASLCSVVKGLQHILETTGHRAQPSRAEEKHDMTILMTVIGEIRNSVAQICVNFEKASILLKNVHRTVFHMNTRIESVLSQGSFAQEQQGLDNIQELSSSV
ncbi:testis-specific serine kinase substrate isoform X2 [Bufo gargarizans]|uniref:testis-specific serine kinase substrate isoform X2 n=1 Tax=Bufo gargarizans TaxID=30331 RepID=UPI001CF475F1|nr:testis-specific serine kinase substrate isoform X2 [Bufo gargarizans]